VFEPVDVIYVNAGATRPADAWLDRLKERGRLILPLTADGFPNRDVRRGVVFRIERCGTEFFARRIYGVAIFPCEGGRDEAGEQALAVAFDKGGAERVTRLYRRDDENRCWLRAGLVSGLPLMHRTSYIPAQRGSRGRPRCRISVSARRRCGATIRSLWR
jgi:hypothetical protein